jgi:sucrose phosphorylase
MTELQTALKDKLIHQLAFIYADVAVEDDYATIADRLLSTMRLNSSDQIFTPKAHENLWDQEDVVLITYGDSVY